MANEKVKVKTGMEGRTTRTARWGPRAAYKAASRKRRRAEDREAVRARLDD